MQGEGVVGVVEGGKRSGGGRSWRGVPAAPGRAAQRGGPQRRGGGSASGKGVPGGENGDPRRDPGIYRWRRGQRRRRGRPGEGPARGRVELLGPGFGGKLGKWGETTDAFFGPRGGGFPRGGIAGKVWGARRGGGVSGGFWEGGRGGAWSRGGQKEGGGGANGGEWGRGGVFKRDTGWITAHPEKEGPRGAKI